MYRKTISSNSPSAVDTLTVIASEIQGLTMVVNMYGYIQAVNTSYPINAYKVAGGEEGSFTIYSVGIGLRMLVHTNSHANKPVYITLEYVK